MQVGIKLWSTNPSEYIEAAGFADFVEVMPVDMESLKKFTGRPYSYTVHTPHESFGFNPVLDPKKSRALLQQGIAAAKFLKSDRLIMHASHYYEKPDEKAVHKAIAMTAKLAREARFPGLLIENSTVHEAVKGHTRHYIGYSYGQMKELLELSGAGFCLDIEHAAITASQLGQGYKELVAELLRLKPEYFQLSGTRLATNGHHLSIFDSDIGPGFARDVLRKAGKPVALETPIDTEQRKKEVEFLKG